MNERALREVRNTTPANSSMRASSTARDDCSNDGAARLRSATAVCDLFRFHAPIVIAPPAPKSRGGHDVETGGGYIERGGHSTMERLQSACHTKFRRSGPNEQRKTLEILLRADCIAPQGVTRTPLAPLEHKRSNPP